MICENCYERPAASHIHSIAGGIVRSRHYCAECYLADSPGAGGLLRGEHQGCCEHCGGEPCDGGTDFLALGGCIQALKFMCPACSLEYVRHVQRQLRQRLPERATLSALEESALLRQLNAETEKHLKEWLAKGGPG